MQVPPQRINFLLLFILIIGVLLRFYGFPHIPFTYDELSAWGRTGYSTFYDLINQGVRGDGHPALIQVFLNYWRKIFGDSEASFKLPFLVMGLCCIGLVFMIGKAWFNETVGIICAAFIAVLQYTVMYSQIARPYICGLFFSLLMVHYWSKYVFAEDEKRSRKSLVLFALFAVLCFYNHYFSLLFACIVGVSGFFFLPIKRWSEYSIAGIAIVMLFLPHFEITMDQFAIGGVGGWLAKPDHTFFGKYLSYIFDFSWWVTGMAIALLLMSFFSLPKDWKRKNKLRLLCIAWFLVPMLIGYFYSRYKNPVLQYSVLIFSLPFLLLFLFSFFGNLKTWQQGALTAVILIVGTYSLVFERQHYKIFYRQPVQQMVQHAVQFSAEHPGKKILIVIQEPQKYMGYYLKKWKSDLHIESWGDLDFQSYIQSRKFFSSEPADYVLCGNVPYDHLLVVKDLFPKLIETEKGFTYEFFCLAKLNSPENQIDDLSFSDSLNFMQPGKLWSTDKNYVRTDSFSGQNYLHLDSTREFSGGFQSPLQNIMKQRDDILEVDVAVANVPKDAGASLAVSFEEAGKMVFYQEKPFFYFMDSAETSGHLIYALRFRDFEFTRDNPLLKIYVWNKNHKAFDITSMKIEIQKGNPLIYSLIEPIPRYAR